MSERIMQDIIPDTPRTAVRRPLRMLGWLSMRSGCKFSLAFTGSLEKRYFPFATWMTSVHFNSVFVLAYTKESGTSTAKPLFSYSQQSPCHMLVEDPKLEDCLLPAYLHKIGPSQEK